MTQSLNIYIYNYNGKEYFQVLQIAELLGYSATTKVPDKISDEYKIKFKDFKGLKTPKIDPRSYLTTIEGISEIVASSDKKIDPVIFNILKSHGVNMYVKNSSSNILNRIKSIFEPEKVLYDYEFEDGLIVDIFFKEACLIVESVKDDSKMQAINELTGFDETNWLHFDADSELFNSNLLIQEIHTKLIKSARQKYFDDENNEGEIDYQSIVYGVQTYVEDKGDHLQYYAVGTEFCSLLGFKNPVQAVKNKVSLCNRIEFQNFNGVKNPVQKCSKLLVRIPEGIQEILLKYYDPLSKDAMAFVDIFHINLVNCMVLRKEQYTLKAVMNAFKTEQYECQYHVAGYRIDFLFTEYNICVEIDEHGHSDRKPENERERMDVINSELGIDDTYWIRINPDDPKFEMSKDIGRINRRINQCKEEQIEREKKNYEEKLILEQQEREKVEEELKQQRIKNAIESHPRVELEKPDIKLEMDETTARIRAPPKEWLLNKLKSHTVEEISRMFGISQKPTRKWIKEYEIDLTKIQEEKNSKVWFKEDVLRFLSQGMSYNEIKEKMSLTLSKVNELMAEFTKDELLEQFKTKNQTEVAMHCNITKHNMRKLLAKYGLDSNTLNSKLPKITKEQIASQISNNNTIEETASNLGTSVLQIEKKIKANNILKIPSKAELEPILHKMSKDDIAVKYKTTRTTLRKWIQMYNLENIRCESMNRPILVIENNIQIRYESMTELKKNLKMSHSKVNECIKNKEKYKGFEFRYEDEDEEEENENDIIV